MNNLRVEQHPFAAFVPPHIKCLIVGSFPGKEQTQGNNNDEAWFYGAPLNQFWKIVEKVYNTELKTKAAKQQLFNKAGIGLADVFKAVRRTAGSNLDENLEIVEWNRKELAEILEEYHPEVLCTSRFVEREFKKMYPDYKTVGIFLLPHHAILL